MTDETESLKISLESVGMTLCDVSVPAEFILGKGEEPDMAESLPKSFVFVSDVGSGDDGSIVVLGDNSLEAIQKQSQECYASIHKESMAEFQDCSTIMSSLSPGEVEKKLAEMLQEKLRLKKALELSNAWMKKYLNQLVLKQAELSKVHEAHRQKFLETKNLVTILKNENSELKSKLEKGDKEIAEQCTQTEKDQEISEDPLISVANWSEIEATNLEEKCLCQEQKIALMDTIISSLRDEVKSLHENKHKEQETSKHPQNSIGNVSETGTSILEEKCLQQEQEIAQMRTTISHMQDQLKVLQENADKNEETCTDPQNSIGNMSEPGTRAMAEKCLQQEREIAQMQKMISTLQEQVKSLHENSFIPIQMEELQSSVQFPQDSFHKAFLESFSNYNERLRSLSECYAAQTSRYTTIQECLQRCSEILAEKTDSSFEEPGRSLNASKDKMLREYRDKLMNEELNVIRERQEMIKSQNEFQQIFKDYNWRLLELESLRTENERLNTLGKGACLHDERLKEAKASLLEWEKLLEEQSQVLEKERAEVAMEKEKIEREGTRLQHEEIKLVEVNDSLTSECASLRELNDVFNVQLKFYETDYENLTKLNSEMRAEKNEMIELIKKLESEKNALAEVARNFVQSID